MALDPLNYNAIGDYGYTLLVARQFGEAIVLMREASLRAPHDEIVNSVLAFSYYWSGDARSALAPCEEAGELNRGVCLALIYWKLGRHTEADSELAAYRRRFGNEGAVFFAMAYAERGDNARALDWLETALRLRNPYLTFVKTSFVSLRQEPRFQAIEKALKFPD
jgi:tetratricopeptide (TPR) repeat protein